MSPSKKMKERQIDCPRCDYLTEHIGTKTESKLVCPRCGNLMDHEFAEDTVVDVCLTCSGVWLDVGEMDSLKDKSKAGYEGDPELKAEELMQEAHAKERRSRLKRFKGRR